jgi:hypothetical protein
MHVPELVLHLRAHSYKDIGYTITLYRSVPLILDYSTVSFTRLIYIPDLPRYATDHITSEYRPDQLLGTQSNQVRTGIEFANLALHRLDDAITV